MAWIQRLLRFDARSLGLFRWLIGLTLITDLLHRWDWLRAFYSNEGVLPNHNHLFILKERGEVWSFYHSFSSVDEAAFAFLVTLFIYVCFTIGWYTRTFHALSLVCLVALVGRNVLLDAVGNSVAIGLLAITLFLPLGIRFGVDSLRQSFRTFDEKNAAELNDRSRPAEPEPRSSLVPLALLGFLALVYYGAALQQTGSTWQQGTALHYALHVDRWTGATGVALRDAPPALLKAWTYGLRLAELAIVPIALVPVARRQARSIVIGLMLFHGLTFGIFFTYGLYGWSLVAAAALMIPEESWDALRRRHPIRLYYDDDCGICLWCARLLKRLDLRNNIRFFPNSGKRPKGASREMLDQSMVVVDEQKRIHVDDAAVSEILRALPPLFVIGWLIRVPGLSHLTRWLYRKVADNRLDISVAVGLDACGAPIAGETESTAVEEAPAQRSWALARQVLASALAIAIVLSIGAQTVRANDLGAAFGLGEREGLARAARWMRITAPFGVWAPDPPQENAALVVEAETRSGWRVDPLTGYEPDLDLVEPRRHRKGFLWEAYQRHIQDDEYEEFRPEFRRYLVRGGFAVDATNTDHAIKDLKAHWVTKPIAPPGETTTAEPQRREIFSRTAPDPRPAPRPRIDPSRFPGLKRLR